MSFMSMVKIRLTPRSCMVTPYSTSASSMVPRRWVMTMNWVFPAMRRIAGKTQFIVITHRRGTMEEADVLYGVTMQAKGVSRILTINLNDMAKDLKIK